MSPATATRVGPLAMASPVPSRLNLSPGETYTVSHPLALALWTRSGWGLIVTSGGLSRELGARGAWSTDRDAMPGETTAGLGWRWHNLSAVIGYREPMARAVVGNPRLPDSTGVVGVSFALHSR
jgi:hypothetical protein